MSSLIFAQAKAIRKKACKYASSIADPINNKELYDQSYKTILQIERNEFKAILEIAQTLHEDYLEVTGKTTTNWYFITIRPDSNKINFHEFYKLVQKFIQRKFIINYTLSFEQKGTTQEELGKGFHVHIVADTKHRSKGECLRDTQSTFACCTATNCIDVKPTREPENIITKYLKEYTSDDGHKEITKTWDNLWRSKHNLKDLYEGPEGLPPLITVSDALSSSPGQGITIHKELIKLSLA